MMMPSPSGSIMTAIWRHRETGVKRIIGIGVNCRTEIGWYDLPYVSRWTGTYREDGIFVGIIYDLTEKKHAEETILTKAGCDRPAFGRHRA
jgi:hypothetical protein